MDNTTASSPHARRNRWLAVALISLVCAAGLTIKYTRHYVFPKRFAVVEPGQVYRAGYCEPGPLQQVISENKIRTILTLLEDQSDNEEQQREEAVARTNDVRILRIAMPGNGCAAFPLLDQASAVIADPANRPILVHCAAGVNRTGAVIAAWRMKYCGWTCDQALDEAEARGMSREFNPGLFEHIRQYAAQMNKTTAPASQPS